MFTEGKVINPEKIKRVVAKKQGMTIESIEEKVVSKLENIRETLNKEESYVRPQDEKEITSYDAYQLCCRMILYGLTLDELEFINDNNLFGLQRENLLDYRCQLILEKKIEDFRQTLDYLSRSVSPENVGSYFQKFGNIHNQSLQGSKIAVILGLGRGDTKLTPLGEKLKTCIENIRKIHLDFMRQVQDNMGPTGPKK